MANILVTTSRYVEYTGKMGKTTLRKQGRKLNLAILQFKLILLFYRGINEEHNLIYQTVYYICAEIRTSCSFLKLRQS